MLKKLLKYDLKSSVKIFTISSVIMMIVMFLGGIAISINDKLTGKVEDLNAAESAMVVLCGLVIFFAFAMLFVYSIVLVVLVVRRFYCSFFTDEGYLTFTLPTSIHSQLISKTLFGTIYSFAGLIVQGLSLMLCGLAVYIFSDAFSDINENLFYNLLPENSMETTVIIMLTALFVVCAEIFSVMVLYLAFTVGSAITGKYKLIAGIAVYFGINTVLQFVPIPLTVIFAAAIPENENLTFFGIITSILVLGIVISLIASVICYFVTHHLLKTKLNLA